MIAALCLVISMLLAGYVARRLGRFPEHSAPVLNAFVIDICLPATILRLVPKLHFHWSLISLAVVPWIIALIAWGCARLAERLLGLDAPTRSALFLATALGNTSFLGFPLCSALLGEQSLPLAAVYDQLGSFLLVTLVAPLELAATSAGPKPSAKAIARRVLLFPPFIALVLACLPLPRPASVDALLATAAAPLVPVAMFAVGLKLRLTPPRPARALALGLTLKLLILPAIAWPLARWLGAGPRVLDVVVLETAMPTMITAGALLMAAGVAVELSSAFVGWGLLLSLLTVPAWSFALR